MRASSSLIDLGVRAAESWRAATRADRDDALQTYAAHEVLLIGADAAECELWDVPQNVGVRIVLDYGCRQEAARRGHAQDAPIAIAVAQARELQDFRLALEKELAAVEDWKGFVGAVRDACSSAKH